MASPSWERPRIKALQDQDFSFEEEAIQPQNSQGASQQLTQELKEAVRPQNSQGASQKLTQKLEEAVWPQTNQGASQKLTQELKKAVRPHNSQGASQQLTQELQKAVQPQSQGASQDLTQLEEAIHPQSQGAYQEPDTSQSVEKQAFLAQNPQKYKSIITKFQSGTTKSDQLHHQSAEDLQTRPCKVTITTEQTSGHRCFRGDLIRQL